MHTLSVLAMFKNESSIIEEWIQHYLREGVDHFYLIDNGSDDDYESKIEKYQSHITLVKDPRRFETKTQSRLYNEHFLNIVKRETVWLIICDIDEYFYLANDKRVVDYFDTDIKCDQIWVPWRLFGTKYIDTPKSLVKSLLLREDGPHLDDPYGHGKSIVRTCNLRQLDIHLHAFDHRSGLRRDIDFNDLLRVNHYRLISENYYKNNKCIRGGGESGHTRRMYSANMKYFHELNNTYLKVEDTVLAEKY